MASSALTPLTQIFWHFSLALHHLPAGLDHAAAQEVLTSDAYLALEATGHTIVGIMDRLAAEDDGSTDAP